MLGYISSGACGREFVSRDMSPRSIVTHRSALNDYPARSSPAESPPARLVEMIADQFPKRSRVIEFELNRERHDAIRHTFAAAQAREILFRRHQRKLLALGVRDKSGDLV